MERVGIVGSGIAGLGCTWQLRDQADITLIEQNNYFGGHTNTRVVDENGTPVPIDTGFIVFNKVTYPNLVQLFDELGVRIKPSEMSFAVRHDPDNLEYNGMSLGKLFSQRRNLVRPAFYRMLRDVFRFFRLGSELIKSPSSENLTLREFAASNGLGRGFLEWYLLPMGSAVWSTDPRDMLDFPASTLIRFFANHGFLGVNTHHNWFTVDGGAKVYVEKILKQAAPARVQTRVIRATENNQEVRVETEQGETFCFDRLILACHADQALGVLASPRQIEQQLLSPFRYQKNHATLHTNPRFAPRCRAAWASWNFLVPSKSGDGPQVATTHYWMNALQQVSTKKDYFVSLNSRKNIPDEDVLYETEYEHPVFNSDAIRAQLRLSELNTRTPDQRIFFCGSYFSNGFHEDAYKSAVDLCKVLKKNLELSETKYP